MRKNLYILICLAVAVFLVWFFVFSFGLDKNLKVYFLDVGQGDAVFLETPDKVQVLIDGGPDNSVLSELSKVMPFYDKEIDLLVLSHPQKDHIFGLIEVLKRYKVKSVLYSDIEYENSFYDEFKKIILEKNINKIEAKAGVSLSFGEFVFADVVYPFFDISGKEISDPNDASLALVVSFLNRKFLFAGDAELKEELELVNSGINIDVDVLKADHHGSKTSNSELFLESTTPELFVISVGKKNPYRHPSDVVLKRLKNTKVLRTDLSGMVKIITDGKSLEYKTEF